MATRSSLPESCKYWPPSTGRRWRFWKSKAVCLRKNNYLRFKPHCDTETLLRGLTLQRGQFFLYFVGIRRMGRIGQVGMQLQAYLTDAPNAPDADEVKKKLA